ncbi:MAG: hypothetical protein DWB43_07165 [Lautropia sp.]|jgi:hypothetical protein|nr:MAG: hypothetical protein EDM78_00295 [Pseudomonadota bacterium]MBC6959299.1 hypothetical protein [Lautropia sp.]MCL4701294.1 hypothetical protein [Burkholderiaceae bacterium]MCZ2412770.1 hypothetical protein [Burkholderiales bacterium]MDL1907435.1 hypothetical protein [Betaproteobacteria bacterium PRO1]
MAEPKRILMVAARNKAEALRMAAGLMLLDDRIEVAVWGAMPSGPAIDEQLEALDFAEVPVAGLGEAGRAAQLAARILDSDVVYWV